MGVLWGLLTLPYAPVRGLTAVVRVIAREAESEQYNPVAIRRGLEELDRAAAAGRITPEERDAAQQRVLEWLTVPSGDSGQTPSRATAAVRRRNADRRARQRQGRGR